MDAERHDDAEKVFEGLTALDPYNADFHAGLGAIKQAQEGQRGGLTNTIEPFTNEGHVAALTNRAEIYIEMGEYEARL